MKLITMEVQVHLILAVHHHAGQAVEVLAEAPAEGVGEIKRSL